ncbi:MAG: MFS transporter [Spirochaetales bacterium]|nr:MAG: MFS transporter [Spirochaetales bacterium]
MAILYSTFMPDQHSSGRLYIMLLVNFFFFGVSMTILGSSIPKLIREFDWSYGMTGAVLAAYSIGYFLSTLISGLVIHRLGPKALMLGGLVFQSACLILFARFPSPWFNLVLNLGVGLGQGAGEVVTNYAVVLLEKPGSSKKMNFMHAAFCAGAFFGPFMVSSLMKRQSGGFLVFTITACFFMAVAVLFGFVRFTLMERESEDSLSRPMSGKPFLLVLLSILIFFSVGMEMGVSGWSSEYFFSFLGEPAEKAARVVSFQWIGLLTGRLIFSFFYKGTKPRRMLLALSIVSLAGIGSLLLMRNGAAARISVFLCGLGISAVYPFVMSLAGRVYKTGRALGVVSSAAGVAQFVSPFIVAGIAGGYGIYAGFFAFLGMNVLLVGTTLILNVTRKRWDKAPPERAPAQDPA